MIFVMLKMAHLGNKIQLLTINKREDVELHYSWECVLEWVKGEEMCVNVITCV